jgi:hypothetical protein
MDQEVESGVKNERSEEDLNEIRSTELRKTLLVCRETIKTQAKFNELVPLWLESLRLYFRNPNKK